MKHTAASAFEPLEPQFATLVFKPILTKLLDAAATPPADPMERARWSPPAWSPALMRKIWIDGTGSRPNAARFAHWLHLAGISLSQQIIIEGLPPSGYGRFHGTPIPPFVPGTYPIPQGLVGADEAFDNETPDDFDPQRNVGPQLDVSDFPDVDPVSPGTIATPGIGGVVGPGGLATALTPKDPTTLSEDEVRTLFDQEPS